MSGYDTDDLLAPPIRRRNAPPRRPAQPWAQVGGRALQILMASLVLDVRVAWHNMNEARWLYNTTRRRTRDLDMFHAEKRQEDRLFWRKVQAQGDYHEVVKRIRETRELAGVLRARAQNMDPEQVFALVFGHYMSFNIPVNGQRQISRNQYIAKYFRARQRLMRANLIHT